MKYGDLLKDPRWQRKRLEIMQRDDFRCRACNASDATLNVHHNHYSGDVEGPWDYQETALITLCDRCHRAVHQHGGWQVREISPPAPATITDIGAWIIWSLSRDPELRSLVNDPANFALFEKSGLSCVNEVIRDYALSDVALDMLAAAAMFEEKPTDKAKARIRITYCIDWLRDHQEAA